MDYQLDSGAGGGLKLGAIVLSTDETLEYEARQVFEGQTAALMHARIPSKAEVTPEDLRTMQDDMTRIAELLPAGMDAIAYGCTSGATVIGPRRVEELVQAAQPGVPVTNPMSAVIAALKALGVRKIAFVSPYVASVTAPMRAFMAENGIETVAEASFGVGNDRTVAKITERSTLAAMLEVGAREDVEAVFSSCTNLRSFGVIEEAEATLGKPVISSNLALIWHLLQLAGEPARGWGPGKLFRGGAL